jgi:hypothetical protein
MVLKDNLDEIQHVLDRRLEVDCINKLQEDHKQMRVEGWVHVLTIVGHHLEVIKLCRRILKHLVQKVENEIWHLVDEASLVHNAPHHHSFNINFVLLLQALPLIY